MLTKTDLFTTVSKTAIDAKQEPDKPKRPYKKSGKKKLMPTQAERFEINTLLKENLTPKDEEGIVSYINGMSDEKIAERMGPNVSRNTVRHLRQEIFGITRKPFQRRPKRIENELEARVAELEKNLMQISRHAVSRLTRVEEMFNKLCEEAGSSLKINIPER